MTKLQALSRRGKKRHGRTTDSFRHITISSLPKFVRPKIQRFSLSFLFFTFQLSFSSYFFFFSASRTTLFLREDQMGQSFCLTIVHYYCRYMNLPKQSFFNTLHGRTVLTASLNTRQGAKRKGQDPRSLQICHKHTPSASSNTLYIT